MSEEQQVDCLAYKREQSLRLYERIASLSLEQELAFWGAIRDEMLRELALTGAEDKDQSGECAATDVPDDRVA